MALSNWDLLAIGKNGKSCDGMVEGKHAFLEIYKNWVHIGSKEMWNENTGYVKPIIARIQSGTLDIAGLDITAIRHPLQNSIFIFVDAGTYENKKRNYNFFAGIGCYGYYSKVAEYLKEKGIEIEYDDCMIGSRNYRETEDGEEVLDEFVSIIRLEKDDKFIKEIEIDKNFKDFIVFAGVMPETFEAFKKWLTTDITREHKYDKGFAKWLKSIDWNELTRFNQGDAFFVGSKEAGTPVGEQADDTILSKALKK